MDFKLSRSTAVLPMVCNENFFELAITSPYPCKTLTSCLRSGADSNSVGRDTMRVKSGPDTGLPGESNDTYPCKTLTSCLRSGADSNSVGSDTLRVKSGPDAGLPGESNGGPEKERKINVLGH